MRIVSWNVNGIRAIGKKGFSAWLAGEKPGIICLQETKARPEQLGELLHIEWARGREYYTYWASAKKPGYSGVAIYSQKEPLEVQTLGVGEMDDEGRVLAARYNDFVLLCAYFPNSQDAGARLDYKLRFCAAIQKKCADLVKKGANVILAGDYNVAHTAIDLARPKENEDSAGYLPEERAWMDAFLNAGFIDTFRRFHPGEKDRYSWWSYRMNARARNVGWRLDYFCVNRAFLSRVTKSSILDTVEGSDHCPVELQIQLPSKEYA
ncbi:MAG: exodeoxyribonuclease III [Treponema sp.]|jgi:exodeoxyribonuclease-3|nr:exodeoxyribonuclease III [Treponema sp.]